MKLVGIQNPDSRIYAHAFSSCHPTAELIIPGIKKRAIGPTFILNEFLF
jgi:hypothetical protein